MKNLYKILFLHGAPKSTACGMKGYLLAKDDEEVYEVIKNKFAYWTDEDTVTQYTETERLEISKKEYLLNIKGDYFDEDLDWGDAYYGIDAFGWELISENISEEEVSVLLKNKVLDLIED